MLHLTFTLTTPPKLKVCQFQFCFSRIFQFIFVSVGEIPPGAAGMPVEFNVDGTGAGYGNLEISVNGGRVTCHVAKSGEEKFTANFIPHDAGRHRLDVKFNGEKVPGSPWFCEVNF